MRNITPHEVVLHVVQRLNNSVYGNPRYLVYVLDYNSSDKRVLATGYSAKTVPNSSEGYRITNYDGKVVRCKIGWLRNARHIFDVVPLEESNA